MEDKFCIGVDFGTDSVRSLLVNAEDGKILASSVFEYPRWGNGLYCNSEKYQFRQHPLDYIEGLEFTILETLLPLVCN
jgi:L-ribulokinase